MSNLIKNVFAVLIAIVAAAIIAFSIITLGHSIIPTPDGINTNDFESIKANFHLFEAKHFLFPLIAHGIATFVSAYLVSRFAQTYKRWFALGLGVIFMMASISLTLRIGHFNWIGIVEIAQYIPISFWGYKFWERTRSNKSISA